MAESGGSMFKKRTKFQRSRQKAKSASGKIELDRYLYLQFSFDNHDMLNQLFGRLQNVFTILYSVVKLYTFVNRRGVSQVVMLVA